MLVGTRIPVHVPLTHVVASEAHSMLRQVRVRYMSSSSSWSVGTNVCASLRTTGLPPRRPVTVMRVFWSELEPATTAIVVGNGKEDGRGLLSYEPLGFHPVAVSWDTSTLSSSKSVPTARFVVKIFTSRPPAWVTFPEHAAATATHASRNGSAALPPPPRVRVTAGTP
jgi:Zn-dependent protease with chaperone function